jgi:hypothetical protein
MGNWFSYRGPASESVAQFIYAMWGMFASRRGSLSAPVIKHGKFVLSFYSILINMCMYRKWCEGISDTTALETSHQFYARPKSVTVRAFISAVDSFRYRQLHQRSATNVGPASRSFPSFLHGWTHRILWHVYQKPELWSQQRQPLLGNNSRDIFPWQWENMQ